MPHIIAKIATIESKHLHSVKPNKLAARSIVTTAVKTCTLHILLNGNLARRHLQSRNERIIICRLGDNINISSEEEKVCIFQGVDKYSLDEHSSSADLEKSAGLMEE